MAILSYKPNHLGQYSFDSQVSLQCTNVCNDQKGALHSTNGYVPKTVEFLGPLSSVPEAEEWIEELQKQQKEVTAAIE